MDFIKNTVINWSPYKERYIDLLLENCLHNECDNILNDKILRDALFNLIVFMEI